ncbi:YidB family protein [Streptomyces sp. NPDC050738]|uniref:YidB family protein n=1 Tax=Streptomyces sp. NPDC050738 TaxID=3154744 RepID=UPI003442960E
MAGNDLGSLLGGLLGGGGKSAEGGTAAGGGAGDILGSLLGAFSGKGGSSGSNPLEGLMGMLTKSGLMDQAQSWVGGGDNKQVSGEQIAQALPDETLQKVADEAGVSTQQAADQIAQSLPQAVDKLTPGGEVPHGGSMEDLIKQQQL